jgi:hypothetical protein
VPAGAQGGCLFIFRNRVIPLTSLCFRDTIDTGESMTNHRRVEFRIRHLDDDIHHLLKIRAVTEKKTMNQVIIEALAAYVKPPTKIRPK